jgi:hypothetical protein
MAIFVVLALAGGVAAQGQDIRAANGVVIKGQVLKASDAGLEVQTQTGPRTYTWETLSAGTRFRWQPVYRANYEAILAGQPPSSRTITPDDLPAPAPEPQPVAPPPAAAPAAQGATVKSMLLFDQAQYENVEPIGISQFPKVELRTPDLAAYLGLQYGAGKNEVVYLALDTKGPDDPFDMLYVYSPGVAAYTTPLKIIGFKRSAGVVNYKRFKLTSQFGQVTTDFDVECGGAATLSNVVSLSVSAVLAKDDVKSKFDLIGPMANLVQGDGLINVSGLLDLPVLWVSLDITGGVPSLVGNLNMAHLKIIPKEGMDNRVTITITSDEGEPVQREAIKIDDSASESKYSITCPLKKLIPGKTYIVRAAIDLGPFFGPASFEDRITLPATPTT